MAVRGKNYPYLGAGRELFADGGQGYWYLGRWYDLGVRFYFNGTTPETPLEERSGQEFTTQFNFYRVAAFWSAATKWPFDAVSTNYGVIFRRLAGEPNQEMEVSVVGVVPIGGTPFFHIHSLEVVVPLTTDMYASPSGIWPAVRRFNGGVVTGDWSLVFFAHAVRP